MGYAIMGQDLKTKVVTMEYKLTYRHPTPVGIPLKVVATLVGKKHRIIMGRASILAPDGTTLVEAKLLNRDIIGVDVNDIALERCREKVNFSHEGANGKVYLNKGDARNLSFIPDNSIDLICTHPPYADIIHYSEDIKEDLSLLKVKDFLEEMKKVASESYRVLKKEKFCAILMGDTRQKGCMIPMSFEEYSCSMDEISPFSNLPDKWNFNANDNV